MNESGSKISASQPVRHGAFERSNAVSAAVGAEPQGRVAPGSKQWIAASMRLAADLAALPPYRPAGPAAGDDDVDVDADGQIVPTR